MRKKSVIDGMEEIEYCGAACNANKLSEANEVV